MRRTIILIAIISLMITGCKTDSKTYGDVTNWDSINQNFKATECHVFYAQTEDGCYSDGSAENNAQYDYWVESYERRHN